MKLAIFLALCACTADRPERRVGGPGRGSLSVPLTGDAQSEGAQSEDVAEQPGSSQDHWTISFEGDDEVLAGWAFTDCGWKERDPWVMWSNLLELRETCEREELGTPGLELGAAAMPPDTELDEGWLVAEVRLDDSGAVGFQYGGHHFTYYRASLSLADLRARVALVARPPFGLDGEVAEGAAALTPSVTVLGETLWVFPPLDTWFELALHWEGRHHTLYLNREPLLEATVPVDHTQLPGGMAGLYIHQHKYLKIRSFSGFAPGPPPWERKGATP